jgi:hypothetical protein
MMLACWLVRNQGIFHFGPLQVGFLVSLHRLERPVAGGTVFTTIFQMLERIFLVLHRVG